MKKSYSLFASLLFLCLGGTALAQNGHVVISQVYGGGGNLGATYKNDFIELYNPTRDTVYLNGWSVQYASANGNTWARTPLAGYIKPGGYYLIQQAQGAGGTVALPAPDAVGTILMAAGSGKVALVRNATILTAPSGGCPAKDFIVDQVSYGSSNCFDGSGPTGTLSSTESAIRKDDGCTDTDNNAADF